VENRFSLLRGVPEEDEAAGMECMEDHVALHVAEEVLEEAYEPADDLTHMLPEE
jgi:hypothetical protein